MRRLEREKQMHMVRHTAHPLWDATKTAYGATQIFVELASPRSVDDGLAVLRGEDRVKVKARIGRGHIGGL